MSRTLLLSHLPASTSGRPGWPWTAETIPPPNAGRLSWPRITVVMPSYQQASFLEEAIRSVLLQNYPNLEFMVNDGGSSDGSVAILERYRAFLTAAESAPDGGQGAAINKGLDRGTGEILGWLNSDDFYLPGALFSVAVRFMHGDADLVYGDAFNLHADDGEKLEYWGGYWVRRQFLQFGGLLPSHATFWSRTIHERIWEELNCNVDGELWQRLVPGRRVRYLPQPLAVFRLHKDTKSQGEQWRQKWAEDDKLIWTRHGAPRHTRLSRAWFNRSQQVFRWLNQNRNKSVKRAILAACQWPKRTWIGPAP
ncbi:MAG: glycosyltransferase family 2 protein [Nibricoccus sp.]